MICQDNIASDAIDLRSSQVKLLKKEPFRFDGSDGAIEILLAAAVLRGASDISIASESPIHAQINGRQYIASERILQTSEVEIILSILWRSADASGIIHQGRALDFSYEVIIDRATRQRFRINATGITINGGRGVELTIRALPHKTPSLQSVQLEPELWEFLAPKSGIIVIAGGTGHGKSTTMAAVTRMHLEDQETPRKIIDYQAPIEYTFKDVIDQNLQSPAFIMQSEIGEGRNLPSFGRAIWSSLRRAPQIINVGESRDYESMSGCIAASVQGHIVNTTTHAGSIAEALRRMVMEFPPDEQKSRAYDLITSLKVIIAQHLVPTPDYAGRFAVREYMVFTDDVRDRYLDTDFDAWTKTTRQVLQDAATNSRIVARPLSKTIENKINDGLLSPAIARGFLGSSFLEGTNP